MPLVPLALLFAQGASTAVDVPVLHRRPSKIVAALSGLAAGKVLLSPNDERSTLHLYGPKSEVEAMKGNIRLFDVEPRKVRLAVRLENPIDHADWKGSIEIRNNEVWTGEDGATGIRLRLSPQVNGDGSCTLMLEAGISDGNKVQTVLRLRRQKEQVLDLPSLPFRPADRANAPAKVVLRLLGG